MGFHGDGVFQGNEPNFLGEFLEDYMETVSNFVVYDCFLLFHAAVYVVCKYINLSPAFAGRS